MATKQDLLTTIAENAEAVSLIYFDPKAVNALVAANMRRRKHNNDMTVCFNGYKSAEKKSADEFKVLAESEINKYNIEIAALEADIANLEKEAAIKSKVYMDAAQRFCETEILSERKDILSDGKIARRNYETIVGCNGRITRIQEEIKKSKISLANLTDKNPEELKNETLTEILNYVAQRNLWFMAHYGITETNKKITAKCQDENEVAILMGLAATYKELVENKRKMSYKLNIEELGPKILRDEFAEVKGYEADEVRDIATLDLMMTILTNRMEDMAQSEVAFNKEFTIGKLDRLVEATNEPEVFYSADVDFDFIALHENKYETYLLDTLKKNLTDLELLKNDPLADTDKVREVTELVYSNYKKICDKIIFWYQVHYGEIVRNFGLSEDLTFENLSSIESLIKIINESLVKAQEDMNVINKTFVEIRIAIQKDQEKHEKAVNSVTEQTRALTDSTFLDVEIKNATVEKKVQGLEAEVANNMTEKSQELKPEVVIIDEVPAKKSEMKVAPIISEAATIVDFKPMEQQPASLDGLGLGSMGTGEFEIAQPVDLIPAADTNIFYSTDIDSGLSEELGPQLIL